MEISISAVRADIVRYYEDRGYSHAHAEAYVPHAADQVMRIYNIIQKEKGTNPLVPNDGASGLLCVQKQVEPDGFWASPFNRAVATFI